jgi:DNA polymerase elongation subunit (family B)
MLLDLVQNKENLEISYWGDDHKTHIEILPIDEKDRYVWMTEPIHKSDEPGGTVRNWNKDKVWKHRLDFSNPKSTLNRYRMYEILDNLPEEKKEKIFSYNLPEMFFIDIENMMQEGKPDPEKADKPITVIGVCCPNDTIMVLSAGKNLTLKEVDDIQRQIDEHFKQVNRKFKFKFRAFNTEYDLLYFFLKSLVPNMAMMTGWNFEEYDWRYIVNRAKHLEINIEMSSPTHKMTGQFERPTHVGLIDYLKAYKKWTWNSNENYKLDYIGEKLCGIKKVQHSESLDDMFNNNFQKYVYYNAIDCGLVKLIHEKCNALTCGITTAWLGRIRAMDCFSTTYIPENLLRIKFAEQGRVLAVSPKSKKKGDGEKYEGAFVKQPIPGLHKYCTCNDYASLYPSLMRQFNIGPETLVTILPENDEALKQQWRDKGYIVCASGAVYEKEDGNLKKIITDLYFKRKAYKKTSFKYTQCYYDLKDMMHNGSSAEEIEDYMKKNDLSDFIGKDMDIVLAYCTTQADIYNNYQLGTKVVINGIYGAFGFAGFYFYNKHIAESVTKQGKHAILNAERLMNLWAQKGWLNDSKTHEKMGLKIIKPNEKMNPVSVYIDTDSVYSSYYQIVMTTDWMRNDVWRLTKINKSNDQKEFIYVSKGGYPTEDDAHRYFETDKIDTGKYEWTLDTIEPAGREFCLTLDRVFMKDFLKKIHEDYAAKQGTPNILDFELEAYNEAGIWLAKKKYVKNMTWAEPNVYYDSCTKIKPTGIEIAQTSSSTWVKEQMTNLIKWIFRQEKFTIEGFVKQLRAVKESFMMQNYETISVNKGMNKYGEYVMDDTKEIELLQKSMVTVQGAAFYNWLLNNNEKYKKKYTALADSDKLCVIYIKPTPRYTYWKGCEIRKSEIASVRKQCELRFTKGGLLERRDDGVEYYTDCQIKEKVQAFSYPSGQYPVDMASGFEIDYDKMFDLLILGPMNRIVEAMGYNPVDIGMNYVEGLW